MRRPLASSLPAFFSQKDIDVQQLIDLCSQKASLDGYAFASGLEQDVLIYEGNAVRRVLSSPEEEQKIKAELNRCLQDGPGVFVVKEAYPDTTVIDASTALFLKIIEEEQEEKQGRGDHFGDNERIWNSFQKVCLRDPDLFIDYYSNPILALASQSWLGPYYQITAQVNNVKPGNKAQSPHRDYHLGFQSDVTVAQFPAQIQVMSQYLTLQGAIAHTDMPLESGPTLFLPFSHQYAAGYMAYRRPEFIEFFEQNYVQLPLRKGDAVFFSPALFHGAGTNRSSNDRLANLVQISSAFGRPMESIDQDVMTRAVYPALLERKQRGTVSEHTIHDTIAAVADGYSFPTNLDSDPPIGGNAPETAQKLVAKALEKNWPASKLNEELTAYSKRRSARAC